MTISSMETIPLSKVVVLWSFDCMQDTFSSSIASITLRFFDIV